ncbi:MAG TPA: PQQ-binding-like beta-propeller repeat protein [Candidatus Acidoferrales bacterium]|nr:PQQ-binding-like beta-propeller repeat protein [Candidatus Acidoferrales bacterium]
MSNAIRRLAVVALSAGLLLPALAQDRGWMAPSGKDFPLVGGNLANQRYSSLAQITPANLSRLGGAWMVHVNAQAAGSMEATPVVVKGVMYIPTGAGGVVALDAATGAVKWKYQSPTGGGTNRGVSVGDGKVFSAGGANTLVALDQETGELAWTAKVGDRGTTVAPAVYYDGLVYMGVSGGEGGVRGYFAAFDAKTGKEKWGFWTTPAPGERGSDTWEGDSWKYGGGPVWMQPAIDPDLGMVYISVGNASPDNDGTERGGNNLFTSSIVALDLKTGAYKWHFQEVHHDLWDYDDEAAPVLADIKYHGQPRKILIHAGKTGFLYIYDRTNGKPLVGIEEKPVPQEPRMKTAATQPFPIGDPFVPTCPEPGSVAAGSKTSCIFGAYWDEPVVMAPGTQGGVTWAPITFDPKTGLVYVGGCVINSSFSLRREEWDSQTNRFQSVGQGRGLGFARPAGEPRSGTLTAMDPATNKIVWQKRTTFPIGTGSGLLTTASGLIFHGESDGRIVAYDVKDGKELWSFQTGAGADAPVITYEVNGQQYVAILAGGNNFQLSGRGDDLWAFKLGGTVPPAAAPPPPPLTQPAAPQFGRGRGRGEGRGPAPEPTVPATPVPNGEGASQ